ncbi:uncharacterized protein Nmag_1659 [Natrialba magadii ATCC 43099]|uniref:HNH endonuclease n=1 Tax=Natrialba magadii (strain ATCC 43099 / DSM 3394 / CCM 3739 / CIP 104546 / IAM 13178 / JCM 8861 / NBRC 102185 / NCIMB 2190 / MS3) TaxID=547559 RepID=D3SUH7_NATMM|nr:HNH endonuclease signature motif containing protein [Natrialba magadii]ADD05235.1 uncharacterized protein Nmag_1659 [Natrialba magadii ATCC 43099]ELY23081.1 HNH endonuclease [Natrialba magadii ATCC 43099]
MSEYSGRKYPWRDPEVLRELYIGRELSIHDISDTLACSSETVGRWLDEHGIETREPNWEKTPDELRDESWLREQYIEYNQSAEFLAERLDCAAPTVRTWLDKHGIERRSRTEAVKLSALHEPARYDVDTEGYARWRVFRDGQRQRVAVHRLLAVSEYGYEEVGQKVVHHKNGIPWDNRPANIEVLTAEEHGRIHANGKGGESA